jgi:hypothetical protein
VDRRRCWGINGLTAMVTTEGFCPKLDHRCCRGAGAG